MYGSEFNANIPDSYYTISPFEPDVRNDLLSLDRVLDNVDECVTCSVRIQPADVSSERHAMTALMERFHSINHGRHFDDGDYATIDYIGDDHKYFGHHKELSPLSLRDPLADDVLRSLRQIHESLCQYPHLFFSIRAMAETESVASLVGSVFADSAFKDGKYRLVTSKKGDSLYNETAAFSQLSGLSPLSVYPHLWREVTTHDYDDLRRLPQLASVYELAGAFRLPVASSSSPLCLRRNTDPSHEDLDNAIILGFDEQGIEGNPNPIPRGISIIDLKKHLCTSGMSGSGKTTSTINILQQLHTRDTPFMVIETVRKEYRVMKLFREHAEAHYRKLAEELEVYTVGNEGCSPLRLNPLEIPPGIDRDAHIENLKDCFLAGMPNFPALPGILGEALEAVYDAHPDPNSPPIMADLLGAAINVLAQKGYSPDVSSNIQAALEVRLGGLTRRIAGSVFKCRHSIPDILRLMSSYSIIELDRLSQDQKCLITLFMLTLLREHLQCLPPVKGLRFVVLIEECHNIFGRSGKARPSEEAPDPKAYVADLIKKMLLELRALGVGVILSDQHPSELDTAAIKSTSSKLAFRQIHGQDRQDLADCMLLTDTETEELARLNPGEAFFFKEGYFRPLRIKTTNLHNVLDLTKFPTDDELLKNIADDAWFQDAASKRIATELDQLSVYLKEFEDKRISVMKRVRQLLNCFEYISDHPRSGNNHKRLIAITGEAYALKKKLQSSYEEFLRGPYKAYSGNLDAQDVRDTAIVSNASRLQSSIELIRKKGVPEVLTVIERLTKNCKDLLQKEVKS